MASIYDIDEFTTTRAWEVNEITHHPPGSDKYWYARLRSNNTPFVGGRDWAGYTTHNSLTKPDFSWNPSYSAVVNSEPKINTIQFGDGYEQTSPEGINNLTIKINLKFDDRNEREAAAILHFLDQRNATESFVYRAPVPYSSNRLFICRSWDSTFVFHDNHSISASFEEVVS